MPFGCTGPLETCSIALCQILTLVNPGGFALGPSKLMIFLILGSLRVCEALTNLLPSIEVPFFPMLAKMYFLIDDFFLTRPPSHAQGLFLVAYYCHVAAKFDLACTTYGGWYFWKICFFSTHLYKREDLGVLPTVPQTPRIPASCGPRSPASWGLRPQTPPVASLLDSNVASLIFIFN